MIVNYRWRSVAWGSYVTPRGDVRKTSDLQAASKADFFLVPRDALAAIAPIGPTGVSTVLCTLLKIVAERAPH